MTISRTRCVFAAVEGKGEDPMSFFDEILRQLRVVTPLWWLVLAALAIGLLLVRRERRFLPGKLLILYVAFLLVATVLSRTRLPVDSRASLVRLDLPGDLRARLTGSAQRRAELILNFCMLIPLGALFPWATKKGFAATVLLGLSLSVLIEFAQLYTARGWFELTDILGNTVGAAIGCGLYCLVEKLMRKRKSR